MKHEFTAQLYNYKIKVKFNFGQPLWFWSTDSSKNIKIRYRIKDQYGSWIDTGHEIIEIPMVSNEQFTSFRLHGEIQNGQVTVCDSTEVPFFLFKRCKWDDDLRSVLLMYMEINIKFRRHIRDMINEMIEKNKMNIKLISLCVFFKDLRRKEFVKAYNRIHLKRVKKKMRILRLINVYTDKYNSDEPDTWWIIKRESKHRRTL